jgi:hypothetical protein
MAVIGRNGTGRFDQQESRCEFAIRDLATWILVPIRSRVLGVLLPRNHRRSSPERATHTEDPRPCLAP